jgi:hypothetical protein
VTQDPGTHVKNKSQNKARHNSIYVIPAPRKLLFATEKIIENHNQSKFRAYNARGQHSQ